MINVLRCIVGFVIGFGLVTLLGPVEGVIMGLLLLVGYLLVHIEQQHRQIEELEWDRQ